MPAAPLTPNAWLRWELVQRELRVDPPGSVLEIGAGQGAVGSRLSQSRRYVGIEPDEASRAVALGRLSPTGSLLYDIADLDADDTFDMVCAFEVLEHIEDDRGALEAWVQHLAPGGRLVLSVPAHQERFNVADELAGHFRRYSRADLEERLGAVGLRDVRIDAIGFPLALVLERSRNVLSARHVRGQDAASTIEDRTAGSGRLFQPPSWAGGVTRVGTAPFRWLQLPFRRTEWASGWLVVGRRPRGVDEPTR